MYTEKMITRYTIACDLCVNSTEVTESPVVFAGSEAPAVPHGWLRFTEPRGAKLKDLHVLVCPGCSEGTDVIKLRNTMDYLLDEMASAEAEEYARKWDGLVAQPVVEDKMGRVLRQ